jgi:tRNA A-37 threonylcarbamoyl transferase component Bud32
MAESSTQLTVRDIAAGGRDLPSRFAITLQLCGAGPELPRPEGSGNVRVECREILRLLPGRRLVARADVAGQRAIVKLFVGSGARRYWARERRGCALLAAAGVATPAMLGELHEPQRGWRRQSAHGLLFEDLQGAQPLSASDAPGLLRAVAHLARLHGAGCRHVDLHLQNFLRRPETEEVFMIDGDGVRRRPLGRRGSVNELALLCAQCPPLEDARLPAIYRVYAAQRGWPVPDDDEAAALRRLAAATRAQRRRRLRRYLSKAQRPCSEYVHERSWRRYLVAVRDAWDDGLAAFAADPERLFVEGQVLKAGNSATVARLRFDGRCYIVKRYNLKGPWHALRRAARPVARFRRAWLNGQRLHMLEIPTARPLLLLERRFGPLRGVAYLVMEDLGDLDLTAEIDADGLSDERLTQVVDLFRALRAAELTHGDTKSSNLLVNAQGVSIIDLDAMHDAASGQERDLRRFLANFPGHGEIHQRFAGALSAAGLLDGDSGFAGSPPSL